MRETNRRQLLKTTAVGTGIALGAGSASSAGSSDVSPAQTPGRSFTGTPSSGSIVIDGDSADGTGSLLGEPLTFAGEGIDTGAQIDGVVSGDGTWESTTVDLPDLTDLLVEIGPSSIIESLDLPTLSENILMADIIETLVTVISQLQLTQEKVNAINALLAAVVQELNLDLPLPGGVTPSAIAFFTDDVLKDPTETNVESLLKLLGPIEANDQGEIITTLKEYINGSDQLNSTVTELEQMLLNLDFASLLGNASIDITADTISGEYKPSQGLVTAPISEPDVTIGFQGEEITTIQDLPLSVNLTTGTSNALTGSVEGSLDGNSPTVNLVDNEFTLGLGGIESLIKGLDFNSLLSGLLEDSNFNLTFDFDPPYDFTGLQDVLTVIDPNTLVDRVDISQILAIVITDQPGRHFLKLGLDLSFEGDSPPDPDPRPPKLDPELPGKPKDEDNDGLYENVRGDSGGPTTEDVQVLFDNLDSDAVQNNSEAYNFSGVDPDEVNILDVQALFNIIR